MSKRNGIVNTLSVINDSAKTSGLFFSLLLGGALLGKHSTRRVLCIAFVTFFPVTTWAQSPRDYLNTPVDAAAFFLDFLNNQLADGGRVGSSLAQQHSSQPPRVRHHPVVLPTGWQIWRSRVDWGLHQR